jgi:hypothetical protein
MSLDERLMSSNFITRGRDVLRHGFDFVDFSVWPNRTGELGNHLNRPFRFAIVFYLAIG